MSDYKILYVTTEVNLFIGNTLISNVVRNTAKFIRNEGAEVRIIVPKFGLINDRKNRLHEVVRLSGMNVEIENKKKSIIIKVASIREERLQVYFIDNPEYFKRKYVFADKNGKFFEDNYERMLFFSKAILETTKQLEWAPNIIHCNGWFSSLIPMFIKDLLNKDLAFSGTKTIYSIYNNSFDETPIGCSNSPVSIDTATNIQEADPQSFDPSLRSEQAFLEKNISDKIFELDPLVENERNYFKNSKNLNFENLINIGARNSDIVTVTTETTEQQEKIEGLIDPNVDYNSINFNDEMVEKYVNIYKQLLKSEKITV